MASLLFDESEQTKSTTKNSCSKTTDKTLELFQKGNIFFCFESLIRVIIQEKKIHLSQSQK